MSQGSRREKERPTWTEEQLKLMIELEKTRQETSKYVADKLYQGFSELVTAYKDYIVKKATRITIPLYILLIIVFVGSALLTYTGHISGEAMVFLTGAIVGYIISLLSEYIGG